MIIVIILKDFGRSTDCLIEYLLVAGGGEERRGSAYQLKLICCYFEIDPFCGVLETEAHCYTWHKDFVTWTVELLTFDLVKVTTEMRKDARSEGLAIKVHSRAYKRASYLFLALWRLQPKSERIGNKVQLHWVHVDPLIGRDRKYYFQCLLGGWNFRVFLKGWWKISKYLY